MIKEVDTALIQDNPDSDAYDIKKGYQMYQKYFEEKMQRTDEILRKTRMKRKSIFLLFLVICLTFLSVLLFFPNVNCTDEKVLYCNNDKIYVYILDPGAAGAKTINVSKNISKYSKKRGNIFCARFSEIPQIFIEETSSNLLIYYKIDKKDIFFMQATDNIKFIPIIDDSFFIDKKLFN